VAVTITSKNIDLSTWITLYTTDEVLQNVVDRSTVWSVKNSSAVTSRHTWTPERGSLKYAKHKFLKTVALGWHRVNRKWIPLITITQRGERGGITHDQAHLYLINNLVQTTI
jgi:hypothetical protein